MIYSLICRFLIALNSCYACCLYSEYILKERFYDAEQGDYVVIDYNKSYSFLHIKEKKANIVTLEEILLPEIYVKKNFSWRSWFLQEAPFHSSWLVYQINLDTAKIEEIYTWPEQTSFNSTQEQHLLENLINSDFSFVPEKQRRKVGLETNDNDNPPIWYPSIKKDGDYQTELSFDVWKTKWKSDDSELSNKSIEIYLLSNLRKDIPYYFPFWIQINGASVYSKLRVIDCGKQL